MNRMESSLVNHLSFVAKTADTFSLHYCIALLFSQSEWYQHTLYELCHPEDAEKICEQLTGMTMPMQGASIIGLTERPSNCTNQGASSAAPSAVPTSSDATVVTPRDSVSPVSGDYCTGRLNSSHQLSSPNNCPGSASPSICPSRILDLKTGTVKKEGHQCKRFLRCPFQQKQNVMGRLRVCESFIP